MGKSVAKSSFLGLHEKRKLRDNTGQNQWLFNSNQKKNESQHTCFPHTLGCASGTTLRRKWGEFKNMKRYVACSFFVFVFPFKLTLKKNKIKQPGLYDGSVAVYDVRIKSEKI